MILSVKKSVGRGKVGGTTGKLLRGHSHIVVESLYRIETFVFDIAVDARRLNENYDDKEEMENVSHLCRLM